MGHLASPEFRRRTGRNRRRVNSMRILIALFCTLTLIPVPAAFVQSGRIKDKNATPSTSKSGRDIHGSASTTKSQPSPPPSQKQKTDDEVEDEDIVRISSTLVTIRASAVDASGISITSLKLEDFELRVDAHVSPFCLMSCAAISAMCSIFFDICGTLTFRRQFE